MPVFTLGGGKKNNLYFAFESFKVEITIEAEQYVDVFIVPRDKAKQLTNKSEAQREAIFERLGTKYVNEVVDLPPWWKSNGGWAIMIGNTSREPSAIHWKVAKL